MCGSVSSRNFWIALATQAKHLLAGSGGLSNHGKGNGNYYIFFKVEGFWLEGPGELASMLTRGYLGLLYGLWLFHLLTKCP